MEKTLSRELSTANKIIQKAQQERRQLLEPEAKELIKIFGIKTTKNIIAFSVSDAVQAADTIGYPVAMKIVSPDIIHKTDAGGVRLMIRDDEGVRTAYTGIIENVKKNIPEARIVGTLVSEMAEPSTEVIIGGLRDPQFGPAVMFGIGGIFVEIFKDVSFRIAPVEKDEALDMIQDIKGYKLLEGYRGTEVLDVPALVKTISHVSTIMTSIECIKEIDLNPIFVYPKGIMAVDARIILNHALYRS
ncbi:MAG: acetyl-CoA synthetase [wastewater metagenome]|nr:acetyl-CoA synthetase [Candidatus Loosdrechtia aerotolerans]